MSLLSELKSFITNGNVVDLAIAVVIGLAFTAVVTAFVSDIITPLIGVAGHVDFSSITYTVNNSTFQIGLFINALISFIIIAAVIFFFVVKPMSKLQEMQKRKQPAPEAKTKECPECLSQIPIKARRCAFCTSEVA